MSKKLFASLLISFLLVACSSTPERPPAANKVIAQKLDQQLRHWRGTPYRIGGNSRKGIDCSAFVQQTYATQFNKGLPRTTREQAKTGKEIDRDELQAGDLLFFKTGWRSRHVGIYRGNGEFIHASKSKGVTKTALSNPYWKARYWQARRLLN